MPPFKSHTSSFRLFKVNCEQSCKGMSYVVHFFLQHVYYDTFHIHGKNGIAYPE